MTASRDRIAFLFGGISTEHESSVEMFRFLRDELNSRPLGFAIPQFYFLDTDGSVRFFRSAENFEPQGSFGETAGGEVMSRSEFVSHVSESNAFVFSLLQGREGEDGVLQGMMDFLDIPSNLGSVGAAYLSIDKWVFALAAKARIGDALKPIDSILLDSSFDAEELEHAKQYFHNYEFVAKPNRQGASVLLEASSDLAEGDLERLALVATQLCDQLLLQERIAGTEITCGCIKIAGEWRSLGCIAVEPASGLMGRLEKSGRAHYSLRSIPSENDLAKRVEHISLGLATHFDFHTQCRFDFIATPHGNICLLEANSKPGLLRTSLYVTMLKNAGLGLQDLIQFSIENESERRAARFAMNSQVKATIGANGQVR